MPQTTMKKKRDEILNGRALLRVESSHKAVSNTTLGVGILLQTIGYIIILVAGRLWLTTTDMQYLAVVLVFSIVYAVMLYVLLLGKSQGNPLLITDKGMVVWPLIAEYWKDIQGYSWEVVSRRSCTPAMVACLRIKANGILPRNIVHHLFGTYLIMFSSEQQAAAEIIFVQHGIKKEKTIKS